jgi:SAM-dependent methyltransferase
MTRAEREAMLVELDALAEHARIAAQAFTDDHEALRQQYARTVVDAVQLASSRLREDVSEISGGNRVALDVADTAAEYVDWLQWVLWDLPYFAVAVRPDADRFTRRLAACAMVYFAGRIFDDVVDRHFWYKGRRPTLLAQNGPKHPSSEGVEGLTVLTGLLLCAEGFVQLLALDDPDQPRILERVAASFRRSVIGAIMENTEAESWSADYYERLIHLKNVDYWRCVYTALDPQRASPLYPFLERYYALGQKLNDVQDAADDLRRGQPNLVALHLSPGASGNGARGGAPPAVEELLAREFLELGRGAEALPPLERGIAFLKLGESLAAARRLGLFSPPLQAAPPAPERAAEEDGLQWYSDLREVVERHGADALEDVPCGVCGGAKRTSLFRKQGFAYHRCRGCGHVYVSPRIKAEIQLGLGAHLDHDVEADDFLEVQRIFAEPICHLMRLRARGRRLLDLGFGRGYVMRLARAYGFEVHGLDSSAALTEELRQEFGHRVACGVLGRDPIPWSSFDVVVMSHVVEHLADPGDVLRRVHDLLNPGGLLYVAVPNLESLQYRIFGKHWDVVNPLAHLQYFGPGSLQRLLADCGFENVERIQYPPLPRNLTPRWMQLFRKLGGDESGELAVLAQRPAGNRQLLEPSPAGGA